MKRCPECRRDYFDDSLLYCLEDGATLVQGSVPSPSEPPTAILPSTSLPSEAQTRAQFHTTEETAVLPSGVANVQPKKGPGKLLLLGSMLVAAVILGSYFIYQNYWNRETFNSIAVMPFANVGGDPEFDYLSDGLAEALINNLSRMPNTKVIARSSTFTFKGKEVDPVEAAQKLNVQAIVTGRVQRRGDDVTISVEMVNAADRTQIWGEIYDRKASEMHILHREISRTVSEKLRNRLTGEQERMLSSGATTNPEAYEQYLKGTYFRSKGGRVNNQKALEHFEQAVAIDPSYANAYASLSVVYGFMTNYGTSAERKYYLDKRAAAVQKALEIAPDSDQVLNAYGAAKEFEYNWAEAESAYRRAIGINPNYVAPRANLALIYSALKRHDEAIALGKRAIELDPLRASTRNIHMYRLIMAGRPDEALLEAPQSIALAPENPDVYINRGGAFGRKRMFPEAIADLKKAIEIDNENIDTRIDLATIYANSGDRPSAEAILRESEPKIDEITPASLAGLYAALGDNQKALDVLENAMADGDTGLQFLGADYIFEPLRGEPRYKELLRKLNLPE
jgi:TolB-like protein/tetratricopeptide (TPR) repeat protein